MDAEFSDVRGLLRGLGVSPIPESVLAEVIELAYQAGVEAGRMERLDRCEPVACCRQLLHRVRVLTLQVRRLLKVNRHLFALMEGEPARSCDFEKAVDVFTSEPKAQVTGRPKRRSTSAA